MGVRKVRKQSRVSTERLTAKSTQVDPALAVLFESTLNPSTALNPSFSHTQTGGIRASLGNEPIIFNTRTQYSNLDFDEANTTEFSQDRISRSSTDPNRTDPTPIANSSQSKVSSRKRKRKDVADDIEGVYLHRLAEEESREEQKRWQVRDEKRQKSTNITEDGEKLSEHQGIKVLQDDESSDSEAETENNMQVPMHESLQPSKDEVEIEKASRTIFLGNVSTSAIKSKSSRKLLLDHLISFIPLLPEHQPLHQMESLRFRSTAFSTASIPKKAAYVKKELMDETTKSTNAYAVYSTSLAAREAAKRLNGSVILERHLRVDSVAHPAKIDHRRCVFIGNLGFVADESMIRAAEDEENNKTSKKAKEPADAEEGLWRQFGKAGKVESVRVIRDKTTRVGKGVAYIQFQDPNAVEKALLYNEKKFPPLLPRILRVTRAKNIKKTASYAENTQFRKKASQSQNKDSYRQKVSSEAQSLSGRAGRLLGRAGAAHIRSNDKGGTGSMNVDKRVSGVTKTPEAIVFEGYRAGSKRTLKSGGRGTKQGKPGTRSSKRGAAFKASGGQKQRSRESR